MNLGFAGSDDKDDWLHNNINFLPGGPGGKYHRGVYNYQEMLRECVTKHRNQLRRWGIELDYIVGHSLGGAAATIYAQEHGNGLKGVVTWGAPKSNQLNGHTTVAGWRFTHWEDPVTSNMCFAKWIGLLCPLKTHRHVVSRAFQYYDKLECTERSY